MGNILFCNKVFEISVLAAKHSCVQQHYERRKHQKYLHVQSVIQNKQKLVNNINTNQMQQ